MYTKKEVERITKIPLRRIQFYTESGIILVNNSNTGRGVARNYSKDDIIKLLIIKSLWGYGITISKVRDILKQIPMPDKLKYISYVCIYENCDLVCIKHKIELSVVLENHLSVLIIDIGKILKSVE